MWKTMMVIGTIAALASCQESATPVDVVAMTAGERAACHADYGKVEAGLFGNEICVRPTTDGGDVCTSSRSCEGLCLAIEEDGEKSGYCSEDSTTFGCTEVFEDGDVATLCID
ncbi:MULTISPECIES: hypothetical protein [Rhodobacterales]|uniref:Lipoprotein n=1 Tax=Halocynthiibacter styelae TaxID=2761955 RepID=A0A8J7IEY8_9RHOB|nr:MULTISPECIES: hypothetical protein [Rhodobacterales]MBI1495464.1 hypothetical protein [Paenihalocynthiibacter styelae]